MKRLLQYFRWLYRYSEGARSALLGNILLGVATVVLNLVFIWMCKSLVDIATKVRPGPIGWYTAAVFVIIGLRLICSALNLRLENITTARMNFLIRKRIYANLLGSQWTGKERFHTGDTLNRLMSDVDKVTQVICSEFPTMVTTLVQLVAAFAFFCLLEWRLALLLVLVSPAFLAFGKLFFRRMHGITKDIRDSESRIQSHIQESLQHRNVIRSLETGEVMRERLDDLQETEFGQILDRTRFNIFSRTVVGATFNLGYIAAFLWGVYGILHGSVTFGLMTAFLQLVGQIQSPLLRMTHQIPAFVYATASIDRLAELEGAPQEDEGEPIVLEGSCGIRVEHLSFRYPDGEEDIFRDFSFDFAPGSRTAVVGETGVGKSTLIRLMLALLRPTGGLLKLYNEQLEEVEMSARTRRNLVYVPQGNSLFSKLRKRLQAFGASRKRQVLGTSLFRLQLDLRQVLAGHTYVLEQTSTFRHQGIDLFLAFVVLLVKEFAFLVRRFAVLPAGSDGHITLLAGFFKVRLCAVERSTFLHRIDIGVLLRKRKRRKHCKCCD